MNKKLTWKSVHKEISENEVKHVERYFNIEFPDDYIKCIRKIMVVIQI